MDHKLSSQSSGSMCLCILFMLVPDESFMHILCPHGNRFVWNSGGESGTGAFTHL